MDFGVFLVWTITNKAPMNIGLQVFIDICFYFSWKKYLRAEWLGHMVSDALPHFTDDLFIFYCFAFFLCVSYWIVSIGMSLS